MLPKPFGTGTKGTSSRTAAAAAALWVASPPTQARWVKFASHVLAQRRSALRLLYVRIAVAWPRCSSRSFRRRAVARARPSPDPGVTMICIRHLMVPGGLQRECHADRGRGRVLPCSFLPSADAEDHLSRAHEAKGDAENGEHDGHVDHRHG